MAELSNPNWSEIDADNNSAAPDGWDSGVMLPIEVEPTARSQMGGEKRFWDRINGTVTTTGTSGTYSYATVNSAYPTSYVQGETFRAKLDKSSAGGDTFQVNALGTKNIYKITPTGAALLGTLDLLSGDMVEFTYDPALNSAAGGFVVRLSGRGSSTIPYLFGGLGLKNNSGAPTTTVDIAPGSAADSTNSIILSSASTLSPIITASGALGLDTGTVSGSTWYALVLISGTVGVSALFTKETAGSSISPTLPAGYTYYRYLGSVLTDGSSHILAFTQVGSTFYLATPVLDVYVNSTLGGLKTLTVPLGVKVQPLIRLAVSTTTAPNGAIASSPDESSSGALNIIDTLPGFDCFAAGVATGTNLAAATPRATTNTSGQLRITQSQNGAGSFVQVITRGWVDLNIGGTI